MSLSYKIPSKQHNMTWQVIVSSTKIFCLKQPTECFKHKVLPLKAHVLSQENEHVNITRVHASPLFAFCRAYRLPSSCRSFPLFWALPSVDKNQNIPTLLTWRFQDNDRSPTRPFQPPCWTRQQHVSEAGVREDPGNQLI